MMLPKYLTNWRKNILDKYKVKLNSKARRDIEEIYKYIAVEKMAPENAKNQANRIKNAILNLDTFP